MNDVLSNAFYRTERIGLFIDGSNLYAATKSLGFDIDFKLLRKQFSERASLVRAYYYTAVSDGDQNDFLRPLVDFLSYNGYTMVTKRTKEYTDAYGNRKIKGNMDVELTVGALEIAPHLDHAVIFSGDGDFCPLVQCLQKKGVRVTVISSTKTDPSMMSDDLRRQCDSFIDLVELRELIERRGR